MFQSIGTVLAGMESKQGRTPIHRNSHPAGQCEGTFWRRTNRQEVSQIVLAAKRYELAGLRQKGRRNGPLGNVAIEVLDLLANLVNYTTGRLDPSLDYLMRALGRSRAAIVRALKNLRNHGFLDWLCRTVPTGNEGQRGPQVRQTSNAYRLSLPERARRLLGRFGLAPPPPDDVVQERAERQAMIEAHRQALSPGERALFDIGDNPLGQALARLGRLVRQRESARQTETISGSLKEVAGSV